MKNYNTKLQKQEVVYVLISLSRRTFLIAHSAKESLRETYRHHLKLRRTSAKTLLKALRRRGLVFSFWKKSIPKARRTYLSFGCEFCAKKVIHCLIPLL